MESGTYIYVWYVMTANGAVLRIKAWTGASQQVWALPDHSLCSSISCRPLSLRVQTGPWLAQLILASIGLRWLLASSWVASSLRRCSSLSRPGGFWWAWSRTTWLLGARALHRGLTTSSWMDLASEVEQLRLKVAELTEEQDSQRAELTRLRRAIAGLRAGGVPPSPTRSCYANSEETYSLVDSEGGAARGSEVSHLGGPTSLRSPSAAGSSSVAGTVPNPLTWKEREEVCDSIGLWITRCLRGLNRGSSGRDRNPLSSRVWLVIRDIDGVVYDPPLYFKAFHLAKPYVKRGAAVGDSIFIGLPTEKEAIRVVGIAGLTWSGIAQQWVTLLLCFWILIAATWLLRTEALILILPQASCKLRVRPSAHQCVWSLWHRKTTKCLLLCPSVPGTALLLAEFWSPALWRSRLLWRLLHVAKTTGW